MYNYTLKGLGFNFVCVCMYIALCLEVYVVCLSQSYD